MTPERWKRLRESFECALNEPPARRPVFLENLRAEDPELAAEVHRLLRQADADSVDLSHFAERAGSVPPSRPSFLAGQILADRFRIIGLLSRGGMGEVYEAEDFVLGERVAIKTILPEIAEDVRALAMFKQEIQMARRVTHANVCRIYDLIQHGGASLVSMELVRGETLRQHLADRGPMSLDTAMPLIEQMAAALQAAHDAGVIHRDFKPSNVMLTRSEGRLKAVVTDFGLAVPALDSANQTGTRHGTLRYMAPEQIQGGPVTRATDVYGLGLVISEMIGTARPKRWEPILARAQEADPALRYGRPQDLAIELRGSFTGTPPAGSRRSRTVWLGAAATITVFGAFVFWASRAGAPQPTGVAPTPVTPNALQTEVEGIAPAPPLRTQQPAAAKRFVFQQGNWVLLDAFENASGEPELQSLLKVGIEWNLNHSGFVSVADVVRVSDTLRLMKKPPDTRLDRAIAREVALRDGGIAILISGRIGKTPAGYKFSVDLIDPITDKTLATSGETAKERAAIPAAVRRLSNWVREALGEQMAHIESTNREMEKATTPSLEALQWFDQASAAAKRGTWEDAATLNRRALAVDPNFASAHLWLAWALKNTNAPEWEYELKRAQELASTASDRERLFIEGSSFMLTGQPALAVAPLKNLIQRYPDHFFGISNLRNAYTRLGREKEAADTNARLADLGPNDPIIQRRVALRMEEIAPARAIQYARRALALTNPADLGPGPPIVEQAHLLTMIFLDAWKNDGKTARKELDTFAESWEQYRELPMREPFALRQIQDYMGLGRSSDAFKWLEQVQDDTLRNQSAAMVAYLAGDTNKARSLLERASTSDEYVYLILRWRLGTQPIDWEGLPGVSDPVMQALKTLVTLREGRITEGIEEIRKVNPLLGKDLNQLLLDALGEVLDQAENRPAAAAFFEESVLASPVGSWPAFWVRNHVRLMKLYRESGRTALARGMQLQLQQRLNEADADFYLLKQINP